MTRNDIQQILKNMNYRNGSYIKIGFGKEMTTKKGQALGHKIYKWTETTIRLGVNYKNTKYAKARAQAVTPGATQKTPWYKHTDCKYIVEHKDNGKEYLQVFASPNKAMVVYTIDGVVMTRAQYDEYVRMGVAHKISQSNEDVCVMTIPVENIGRLGRYWEIKSVK